MSLAELLLVPVALLPSLLVALVIFGRETNRYWMIAGFLLTVIISSGLNELILGALDFSASAENLLALYGVESLLGAPFLVYSLWKSNSLSSIHGTFTLHGVEAVSLALFLCFVLSIPIITSSFPPAGYTEFYFYETQYAKAAWRETHDPFNPISVAVVIKSAETSVAKYSIFVSKNTEVVQRIDLGSIEPGEDKLQLVVLPPAREYLTRWELTLYKSGATTPYRILYFWIRGTEK